MPIFCSKWKNGESCSAMAVAQDGETLVSASRSIKWWSVSKKSVVRTFTGHATPIFSLLLVSPTSGDNYVISAAQNDRLLNAWLVYIRVIIFMFSNFIVL